MLEKFGFGRAHHRVLHFVNRNPGMKVADLLDILRITKQSLGRVLKQLVDEGYVVQKEGPDDRRHRLLFVTPKGEQLAMKLAGLQTERITRALAGLGPNAHEAARAFPRRDGRRRKPRGRAALHCPGRSRAPAALKRGGGMMAGPAVALPDDAPHLLVVDDDRRIRDLLSRFLFAEGYRVTTANNAADARAKLESLSFDLLVLDVMMPGETGFQLAKSLRETSAVPILMLTAKAETESRITGLELGADDYVPKPFEPRELSLRIANILKRTIPAPPPAIESARFGDFVFHLGARRTQARRGNRST